MAVSRATASDQPATRFPSVELADEPRKTVAIKLWAVIGGLFLAFYVFVMVKWVTGPNFESVSSGSTVPDGMATRLNIIVPLMVVAGVGIVYWFLVRPLVRERRLTTDGLLVLCFILIIPQDPWMSWFTPTITYNTHLPNMGSWAPGMPGWQSHLGSPGAMMQEPLIFVLPVYLCVVPMIVATCWLMRRIRHRYPSLGNLGLISVAFAFALVLCLLLELPLMRTGLYHYPTVIPELTIFAGHYYQYPVYEGALFALTLTSFASLRFFVDDRGRTVVERGIDQLRWSGPRKAVARVLAVLGMGSVIFVVTYDLPWQFFGLVGTWPKSLQSQPYITNSICGPDTKWACPDRKLPVSRRNAIHFGPRGELVVPQSLRGASAVNAGALTTP